MSVFISTNGVANFIEEIFSEATIENILESASEVSVADVEGIILGVRGPINEKYFKIRELTTKVDTVSLLHLSVLKKHYDKYVLSSKEEDYIGIDFYKYFLGQCLPCQMKIRWDGRLDSPLSRFQPWWGMGLYMPYDQAVTIDENGKRHYVKMPITVDGRDWRGLENKASQEYYVAVKSGKYYSLIYSMSSDFLWEKALSVNECWFKSELAGIQRPPSYFTYDTVKALCKSWKNELIFGTDDGCQVWKHKNKNESPKINFYIPYHYKNWEHKLSEKDAKLVEKLSNTILRYIILRKKGV